MLISNFHTVGDTVGPEVVRVWYNRVQVATHRQKCVLSSLTTVRTRAMLDGVNDMDSIDNFLTKRLGKVKERKAVFP